MEEDGKNRILSCLSDLLISTTCDSCFIAFFQEKGVLNIGDVDRIVSTNNQLDKASIFYGIIQQRSNSFGVLLEGLTKFEKHEALTLLTNPDRENAKLSEAQIKSRVRKLLFDKDRTKYPKKQRTEPKCDVSFQIYPPVSLFTGRKRELDDLHHLIFRSEKCETTAVKTVTSLITSVSGLGGIGKTQLSRQYIQEKRFEFDNNCIWLNAENENSLSDSFRRLAREKLRISTKDVDGDEKSIASVIEDVYQSFFGSKALFIFDNVERTPWRNKYLPLFSKNPYLYVLMTSRNNEWESGTAVLHLRELLEPDAVAFVKTGLKISEECNANLQDDILQLVKRLQYYPLAIQQAISYISDQKITGNFSIQEYLQEFERQQLEMLSFSDPEGIQDDLLNMYTKTTFTTWKITIDKIAGNVTHGQLALKLLNIISFLNPERIQRDLFYNLRISTEDNESSIVSEGAVKGAIRILIKYSMINGEENQEILSVHRLVQEVTRIQNATNSMTLNEVMHTIIGKSDNDPFPVNNIDHGLKALKYVWKHEDIFKKYSSEVYKLPQQMEKVGRQEEALQFANEALEKVTSVLGESHYAYFRIQSLILKILRRQGSIREALTVSEIVLEKTKFHHGENDSQTILAEHNHALILKRLNKFNEASQSLLQLYEKSNELFGSDKEITIKIQHNYAQTLRRCGQFNDALRVYSELDKKFTELYGEGHIKVLQMRQNTALVYWEKGNFPEVVNMYREIYKRMNLSSKDYIYLFATICCNYGKALCKIGEYGEALKVLEENYEKMKNLLKDGHHRIQRFLLNIGTALRQLGKAEEAFNNHKNVYAAYNSLLGENHLDTLTVQKEIAEDWLAMGKYEEGICLYKEVLEKLTLFLKGNHQEVVNCKIGLANALERKGESGDLQEALKLLKSVGRVSPTLFGEDSPKLLKVLKDISQLENKLLLSLI